MVLNHGRSCNWHWDQYDWECDCGAIPNAADLKPKWIAESIERNRRLAAQKPRKVSPKARAAARALLTDGAERVHDDTPARAPSDQNP